MIFLNTRFIIVRKIYPTIMPRTDELDSKRNAPRCHLALLHYSIYEHASCIWAAQNLVRDLRTQTLCTLCIKCSQSLCLIVLYHKGVSQYLVSPKHGGGNCDQKVQFVFHQMRSLRLLCSESLELPIGKLPAGCHVPFSEE